MVSTKIDLLNRIDKNYLITSYASSLFGSKRLRVDDKNLVSKIANRLTLSQIEKLYLNFVLGVSPKKIGEELRDVGSLDEIITSTVRKFKQKYYIFFEMPVDGRQCDAILIKRDFSEIIAIEIKSKRDKLKKSIEQCKSYMKWADKTYLLIDNKHLQKTLITPFYEVNGIGILVFENNEIKENKQAEKKSVNKHELLGCFSLAHLKKIAAYFKIPHNGKREKVMTDIESRLDLKKIRVGLAKSILYSFYDFSDL